MDIITLQLCSDHETTKRFSEKQLYKETVPMRQQSIGYTARSDVYTIIIK